MKEILLPEGFHWERLTRAHPRRKFGCGVDQVDEWLRKRAWQSQKKKLTVTQVLLDSEGVIAGFYTLATGQVDCGELPTELTKKLPKRLLPVAVLAWLGVDKNYQCQGIGTRLVAQALRDSYSAGATFPFVAVLLDCLNESAKQFYARWDFQEMPGYLLKLILSYQKLAAIMEAST